VYPPRTLAITLAITAIVWFAGPFGTFEAMHPVVRIFYWGGLILASVPFGHAVRMAVTRCCDHLSLPLNALITASAFSVVYTPVVYLATLIATWYLVASMAPLWTLWAGTFLAAACAYTVRALLTEQDNVAAATSARDRTEQPRLLQRIDAALHAPLVSISVRNHYVEVRTAVGQASLLMRLSDAIAETEGVDGAQVHRSHWVAWDQVLGVDRRGGNLMLRMAHGEAIPVSRNHREKLEERGLL